MKPTNIPNCPPTDSLEIRRRRNAREIIANSKMLPPDIKQQLVTQIESTLVNEKIHCPFCTYKFVYGPSLLKHAERYHLKVPSHLKSRLIVENAYSCEAGQQPFAQEANLNEHKVVEARTMFLPDEQNMILPHSTSDQGLMQVRGC